LVFNLKRVEQNHIIDFKDIVKKKKINTNGIYLLTFAVLFTVHLR
jgi:hypothetical protein